MSYLAVIQQQQITVPENSWAGHISMAGFGAILFIVSVLCIKGRKRKDGTRKPMLLWGPLFSALMNRWITQPSARMMNQWSGGDESEGLDWKSLMTFLVGVWSMTSILSSSPGTLLNLAEWFQGLVMNLAEWPILADIGAGGICFLLVILAMRNRDDDIKDLAYGAICGFFFPLGGGVFANITLQIGNWIPQIMQL